MFIHFPACFLSRRLAMAAASSLLITFGCGPSLESVNPASQRVHGMITLQGSNFGDSQQGAKVLFAGDGIEIEGGKAYLWRDDRIEIRVPAGNRIEGANTPIPETPLRVRVATRNGVSQPLPFGVIIRPSGSLQFRQSTRISGHRDTSSVLGSPNLNLARTKDAEVADVDVDGDPDLLDNNASNLLNSTHSVLRINQGNGTFQALRLEPLAVDDAGMFAAAIPAGGDFLGDGVTYDADFADIDGDDLPDLIQTASNSTGGGGHRVRLLINNAGGIAGRFREDSAARLPAGPMPAGACPDDLAHADVNNDGTVDFAVSLRSAPGSCSASASTTLLFINQGAGRFSLPIRISAPDEVSTRDVFFLDADADGDEDLMLCYESMGSKSQLFLNDGKADPGFVPGPAFGFAAVAGGSADFNADGLADIVLGQNGARIYLNQPDRPGHFTEEALPGSLDGLIDDLELGDLDLDGSVDIAAAILAQDSERTIQVWLNRGDGTFIDATATGAASLLPGLGGFQRLSVALADFDLDGDLDLYTVGADSQDWGPGLGFGRAPNQYFKNLRAVQPAGFSPSRHR